MDGDDSSTTNIKETAVSADDQQTELPNKVTHGGIVTCNHVLKASNLQTTASVEIEKCPNKCGKPVVTERTMLTSSCKTVSDSVRPKILCSAVTKAAELPMTDVLQKKIDDSKINVNGSVSNNAGSSKVNTAGPTRTVKVEIISDDDPVVQKAYSLAKFIVGSITKETVNKPSDKIEETLLRNVTHLLSKHEILFRAMMRRLTINKDTGYHTFATVANELFENEKRNVTWSRIIALYAFGAQLALYCKENNFGEYGKNISMFMGKNVADMAGRFVKDNGGWVKLCEEFPSEHEFGDNMWKVLTWTALGLGIATATMFFSSSH